MGAIAEGLAAYAQPLLAQTDGSPEDLNRALQLSQLCFNLALLPEEKREAAINGMQSDLEMDDEEFDEFRNSIIGPMIRRHCEMFPLMHERASDSRSPQQGRSRRGRSLDVNAMLETPAKKHSTTDRYAPCPCGSGKKYKFCCGVKPR